MLKEGTEEAKWAVQKKISEKWQIPLHISEKSSTFAAGFEKFIYRNTTQ